MTFPVRPVWSSPGGKSYGGVGCRDLEILHVGDTVRMQPVRKGEEDEEEEECLF